MLSFEEFAENVVKEIRVKVGGAFQIKEHKVIKNNSVKRAGIAVMKNEEDIGPCVYLDEFYREYESDGTRFVLSKSLEQGLNPILFINKIDKKDARIDEVVDEVCRLILKHEDDDALDFDISGFKRWEIVRENVYPKLFNAEQNKELLEEIPHRAFMDLAVVYYAVARDSAREDIGTILIYNGIWKCGGRKKKTFTRRP